MKLNMKPITDLANPIRDTIEWMQRDHKLEIIHNSPLAQILEWIEREVRFCQTHNLRISGNLTMSQNRAISGLYMICERFSRANETKRLTSQMSKRIPLLSQGIPSLCSP